MFSICNRVRNPNKPLEKPADKQRTYSYIHVNTQKTLVNIWDVHLTMDHLKELVQYYKMNCYKFVIRKTYPPEITIIFKILDKQILSINSNEDVSNDDKLMLISVIRMNLETRDPCEIRLRDIVIDKLAEIMKLDKVKINGYENLEELYG